MSLVGHSHALVIAMPNLQPRGNLFGRPASATCGARPEGISWVAGLTPRVDHPPHGLDG